MPKRATGVMVRDGRVLLMRRVKKGYEYFVFPGGTVEEGETPQEAVVREIREEFTLDVQNPKLVLQMTSMGREGHYYLITDFQGEPVLGGEELSIMNENNQYYPAWTSIEDIRNMKNLVPPEARDRIADILEADAARE